MKSGSVISVLISVVVAVKIRELEVGYLYLMLGNKFENMFTTAMLSMTNLIYMELIV